jgi:serine protease AprX
MNGSQRITRRSLLCLAVAAVAVGSFADAAVIGTQLAQQLPSLSATERTEVVITWKQMTPVTTAQVAQLGLLGITGGRVLRSLPIAGALATRSQIQALAQRSDVLSIHSNRSLRYFNHEARQISSVERAQNSPQEYGRPTPYSGFGVTVLVNDSGIDATHQDLAYGAHVVQNVQSLTNLHALDTMLPVTYLEGQPNTDTNSGHGTHCAGIIGGTGARSSMQYQGVAPGADLVGYGSGGAIAILDAVGGFDYAISNQFTFSSPIRVISNSWGSEGPFDPTDPVNIASYVAYQRGINVVFAAGNSGPGEDTHNPYAVAPWVISVAAADKRGNLADFSSRGKRFDSGSFSMPDGRSWTYYNQPTIAATGVDVISTRSATNLAANGGDADVDAIPPQYLPFYTMISGTSMATPHVAGIIALLLEANPNLTNDAVRQILERTATNMGGHAAWEVGAGHVNAYAALAVASGRRTDFGATVNSLRTFAANQQVTAGPSTPFSLDFAPVGPVEELSFNVGADIAWVTARAQVATNTVALVLTSPTGERYGSAISLPQLGETIVTSAPGKAGTWKLTVRGIGSISGVGVDPLHVTNGVAAAGTVEGEITTLISQGFSGLGDIAGHAVKGAIEYAVAFRLADGVNGHFLPDQVLTRGQLAEYLTMGGSIRQGLPLSGGSSFADVATGSPGYAFAQAAGSPGGALRDLSNNQQAVVQPIGGAFMPSAGVDRATLAYALVQSLALQTQAQSFSGPVSVLYGATRIAIEDAASIPANLRGYVQIALDAGVMNARFSLTQGPFDLTPVVHATFEPATAVTRAEYAVAAGRFLGVYGQ